MGDQALPGTCIALLLDKLAMTLASVTHGLFTEDCVLFNTLTLAGIALEADLLRCFPTTSATLANDLLLHSNFLLHSTVLHGLCECELDLHDQVSTIKH